MDIVTLAALFTIAASSIVVYEFIEKRLLSFSTGAKLRSSSTKRRHPKGIKRRKR